MTKYVPPGFDRDKVIEGLHKAMGFGEPTQDGDKVRFFFETQLTNGDARDEENVPFDPSKKRPTKITDKLVPVALEYEDRTAMGETFGVVQPASVTLTVLGPDYDQIKGFSWILAGGDQYFYSRTEPPVALGSLDVWTVHCTARDER